MQEVEEDQEQEVSALAEPALLSDTYVTTTRAVQVSEDKEKEEGKRGGQIG